MKLETQRSITLPAQPASVSAARRFVRGLLAGAGAEELLVDDAALVISELVANAVLHAGGPILVEISSCPAADGANPDGLRMAVSDPSPMAPAVRDYGDGASTGRGIALVARLVDRWGVEAVAEGGTGAKVVWVEMGTGSGVASPPAPRVTSVAARPRSGDELAPVAFLGVPVPLYLRLQEQNDAVLRELELIAFTADHAGDLDPSPDLVAVLERSRRYFNLTREGFGDDVAEAARRGEAVVDLAGDVEIAALAPAAELVALFEDAERLSDRGELLVGAADPDVRRLRRWFVSEMSRQLLQGEPAERFGQ